MALLIGIYAVADCDPSAVRRVLVVHRLRALERVMQVRADVGVADVSVKVGASDQPRRLMTRATENQTPA